MKQGPQQPLVGEALWRKTKDDIAKRNDAAQARAATKRAERDATKAAERRVATRLEESTLPKRPNA